MSAFVPPHDPILQKIAEPVESTTITAPDVQNIVKKMLFIACGEQKDRRSAVLVGLAAPQVGISKRIILVDVKADGKGRVGILRVFINPKIVSKSKEKHEWYEGCYSTDRVCGIVSRARTIELKAYDEYGKQISESFDGYSARIFQHEIDHLDGREFVSHITDPENLHWVEEDEFVEYRNNEAWRTWRKKCSFEKWEKIKKG